jgi:hypothetical protein
LNKIPERISELGKLIFGTENPELTIEKLIVFFKAIESPCYLSEIGFSEKNRNEILELMKRNKVSGMNHFLSDNDYEEIVDYMMKI